MSFGSSVRGILLFDFLLRPQVGFDLARRLDLSGLSITFCFLLIGTFLNHLNGLTDHFWLLVFSNCTSDVSLTLTWCQILCVSFSRCSDLLCTVLQTELFLESVLKAGLMRRFLRLFTRFRMDHFLLRENLNFILPVGTKEF